MGAAQLLRFQKHVRVLNARKDAWASEDIELPTLEIQDKIKVDRQRDTDFVAIGNSSDAHGYFLRLTNHEFKGTRNEAGCQNCGKTAALNKIHMKE